MAASRIVGDDDDEGAHVQLDRVQPAGGGGGVVHDATFSSTASAVIEAKRRLVDGARRERGVDADDVGLAGGDSAARAGRRHRSGTACGDWTGLGVPL